VHSTRDAPRTLATHGLRRAGARYNIVPRALTGDYRTHASVITAANQSGAGPIAFRFAVTEDAKALADFGARMFTATFGAANDPRDLAAFLATTYGPELQQREILDPAGRMIVCEAQGSIIGYAYLRSGTPPACVTGRDPVEIARFYVDPTWQGQGLAQSLMAEVLRTIRAMGGQTVWLGVWERNARAIRFYEKTGFLDVGWHEFLLGSDGQVDRLMTRSVPPAA
jgi:ribosomal protein S18 acetylase RimI-like enzyme